MSECSHFANFNLPVHTWYRKNEIFGSTFHIYDWEKKATCSFEEGQSFILTDYTVRPFYTTIHKSLEKVVETLRLIFMPLDNDRYTAVAIYIICRDSKIYFSEEPISSMTQTFLEYYGFTVNGDRVTINCL